MKVREPVARPLDVVAAELLLSASQAFLVGVLVYLAVGFWDDRGVGAGPVAVILALLGLAVGGAWLYWLLGGSGWPLAAVDAPVAMFMGFALVLSLRGEDFLRIDGLPVLLSTAAAIYGIGCGAFLDSPRRWRWDQRQRPRPGTQVPRVSGTTKAVVARIPRSLPRREARPSSPPATAGTGGPTSPTGQPTPAGAPRPPGAAATSTRPSAGTAAPRPAGAAASPRPAGAVPPARPADGPSGAGLDRFPRGPSDASADGSPPTSRPGSPERPEPEIARDGEVAPVGSLASPASRSPSRPSSLPPGPGRDPIELPTSVEPRAQRSPWAWAAPPEWNRDEDDEPPRGGSSRRS